MRDSYGEVRNVILAAIAGCLIVSQAIVNGHLSMIAKELKAANATRASIDRASAPSSQAEQSPAARP